MTIKHHRSAIMEEISSESHPGSVQNGEQERSSAESQEAKGLSSENEVVRTINPQAVLAAFPTADADGLGSANHIQVQLLDGQVIQITSASIVESEMPEGGDVEVRTGNSLRNNINSPRVEGGGSAVTLLTTDGKTYILPQPLNSEVETAGGYLITEEVLNGEAGRNNDLLQHHQVLTLPSSSLAPLQFPSASVRHPDALAIAASEVFNENYSGLSLETTSGYEEARTFQIHVKVPDEAYKGQNAETNGGSFSQERLCTQKEVAGFSDCSIITIHAPQAGEKTASIEKNRKSYGASISTSERVENPGNSGEARKECLLRDIENGMQHLDSTTYSSLYPKISEDPKGQINSNHASSVIKGNKITSDKLKESDLCRKDNEESHGKILQDLQPLSTEVDQSCSSVGLWVAGGITSQGTSQDIWVKGNRDQGIVDIMPNLVRVKKGNLGHDDPLENEVEHVSDSVRTSRGIGNDFAGDEKTNLCSCYDVCELQKGVPAGRPAVICAVHRVCTDSKRQAVEYSLPEEHIEMAEDLQGLSDADTKVRRSARLRKIKELQRKRSPSGDEQLPVPEPDTKRARPAGRGDQKSVFWECNKCDAMFRTKVSRDRHIQEDHVFTCYMCGWQGKNKTKYEVHISTVHCSQQARCLACRKDFQSYDTYKQHMKTAHSMNTDIDIKTETEDRLPGGEPECAKIQQQEMNIESKSDKASSESKDLDSGDSNEAKVVMNEDEALSTYGEKKCPYCGKQFQRRSRLLRHINYHLDNRKFSCEYCNKAFVEKSGLDAHLLTHRPINKSCAECGKVFKTRRTMKRHMKTHRNITHSCGICGKEFRHEESLRIHKSIHKEGGSGNVCTLCKKDCKTPYYLQLHVTTKHEAAKFTCLHCDRSFKWRQSYGKHMAIFHSNADMKYACGKCSKHFKTASELRLHQVAHSDEKKYLCDICGKVFKHEYTRDKHVKTVHQEKRDHMCPQCGSLFKAKAYLDQHLSQVHTTKERVKCLQCGHDFKTISNLKSHIKTVHNSRSPKYACKTCNKTFTAPKDLARHTKVHTGIKDYVCPVCRRGFARKDNMISHMRTHTKESAQEPQREVTQPNLPQQEDQGITHILGLPAPISASRNSPTVAGSSNNIILSSIPVSSHNLTLSSIPASSSIALGNTPVTGPHISLSADSGTLTLSSVSSGSVILSSVPSSSNSIILSRIPATANSVAQQSIASSSNALSFSNPSSNIVFSSTPLSSNSLDLSNAHSTPGCISLDSSTCNDGTLSNDTPTTGSLNFENNIPSSSNNVTSPQVFSLQPHIITSAQHEASSITSLLPPCSASVSGALPTPPAGTASVDIPQQGNPSQMVWSRVGSDQVALSAGVLSLPSAGPTSNTDNAPQYSQTGLYTIVGEGSKVTPLESFTLHPVDVTSHQASARTSSHQVNHTSTSSEQR